MIGQWLLDDWKEYATASSASDYSSRMGHLCCNENYSKEDCQLIIDECNRSGVVVDEAEFWKAYG